MKKAELVDHQKTISNRKYPFSLRSATISSGGSSSEIAFHGGINAICGRNGSGKSILLSALELAVGGSDAKPKLDEKNKYFDFHISIDLYGGEILYPIQIESKDGAVSVTTDDDSAPDILTLNTVREIPDTLSFFRNESNLDELLEQYSPRDYRSEEIRDINYITGNRYQDVQQFEIDDVNGETVPFFYVKRSEYSSYSSLQMGQGEYSLFYIFWLLKRASNCILIIEEPESFTTPDSQSRLASYLFKHSAKKGVWILLSTHSEQILSKLIPDSIHSVYCMNKKLKAKTSNAKTMKHVESLGLAKQKKGIFFVEDYASKLFLECALSGHTSIKNSFYIKSYDGEGNIYSALKQLAKAKDTFRFVGVFDGDLRGRCELDPGEYSFQFLPGDKPPEAMLFDNLILSELPEGALGLSKDDLDELVEASGSLDLHDRIHKLSECLGKSYDEVYIQLFDLWSASENGKLLLEKFLDDLSASV